MHPIEERIQHNSANHKPPKPSLVIEMMRVPFTENVVSRPAGGMALIIGSWIQSQLIEQIQIERRLGQNARIGRSKNLNHPLNKRLIAPPGRAGPANIE